MELFQDKKDKKECAHDVERGCEFCGCQSDEAVTKVCEGCFKLHVTDWLEDYPDNLPDDIYEVRFKNTRRGYYQNVNSLPLSVGDIVAVEASPGHDIGIVSLSGDIVAKQMKRVGFNPQTQNGEFKKIYRKAKPYDIEKWQEAIALEHETMIKARQIAADMNLNMKIGDVEYQGDKIKAIFYYIADERVDFRELIKVFAEVFHIRVEMKQIGARQEAGRIGGIGSCGRELCCASWISSFLSVTTNAARTQDISLNPQKLAGQCSKLKCCLVYEYDDYMDARREFPKVSEPLRIMEGEYFFIKNDILGRTMSFSTAPGSMAGLVSLPIARVREIMKLNAKGIKPDSLEIIEETVRKEVEPGFVNAIGEDSITRFDATRKKKKSRNGKTRDELNDTAEPTLQGAESQPEKEGVRREKSQLSGDRNNRNNRGNGANPRANGNGGQNRRQNNGNRENREQEGRPSGETAQAESRPAESRPEGSRQQPRQNRQGGNRQEGGGQSRQNRQGENRPEGAGQPRQNHPNGNKSEADGAEPRQNRQGENKSEGAGQSRQNRPNGNKPEADGAEPRQNRQGENRPEGAGQPRQNRNNRNGRRPERRDGQPRRESERNGETPRNGNGNAKPQEGSDKGGSAAGEKKTNE